MYYHGYSSINRSNNTELINDIAKSINAEYSAVICYTKLAELAPNQEERDRILEIRQDESRHYETFSKIFISLTGKQHSPKLTEECPKRYIPGLQAFIKDEQDAVDSYLEIAEKAPSPFIKESFKRAAADEQNHAVWFLYFYTKWCCANKNPE